MAHPFVTPTSPTNAAHRSPWHRMPFMLLSTRSLGMRIRSSSSSIVNQGQSLEYEQQAPHELQAPIWRDAWDLCCAILFTEGPSFEERSRWINAADGTAGLAFDITSYWVEQGTFHTSASSQQSTFSLIIPPSRLPLSTRTGRSKLVQVNVVSLQP